MLCDKSSRSASLKKCAGLVCERYLLAILLLCNIFDVLFCVKFLTRHACGQNGSFFIRYCIKEIGRSRLSVISLHYAAYKK